MKKNSFILSLYLLAAGICACGGQQGYTVSGECPGSEGIAVLAYRSPEGGDVRDTVQIADGKFCFSGKTDEVVMGQLIVVPKEQKPQSYFLFLENCPLKLQDGKIAGGPNNDFMRAMEAVGDAVDKEDPEYQSLLKEAMNAFFAQNPDVEAAAFMYHVFNRDTPLEQYEEGFAKFSERVQKSFLGKNAADEIAARKATAEGTVAPGFNLEGISGDRVSLEDMRGKYVLLDFWASWCRPCRASMPHLKEVYAAYKDKGLEIVGISIDTDNDAWRKAVADDQTPWVHVIDSRTGGGQGSDIAKIYGVRAIPTLFMVDPDGNMIGKIEHDELDARLATLLH